MLVAILVAIIVSFLVLSWEHYIQGEANARLAGLITDNKVILLRNQKLICDMSHELMLAKQQIKTQIEAIEDTEKFREALINHLASMR
ncbi:hypothetical protein [Pseudenterobacter timonensis]|uniref:hypothetical protein n=1 Tax=Pseudenterobacter timonensis TaxID=1755099 RepID=UPI00077B831A|nr:hypothetical protein [Pseudenterobacter timonensis]